MLGCVISLKDKICKQQSPRNRLKLRSRDHMMMRRTREHGDSILHSPEETLYIQGTHLEERDENNRQLLLERSQSHPWEQHGDPASPEEDDVSIWSQPT